MILSADDVRRALPMATAVRVVEQGIVDAHRGIAVAPPRMLVDLPGADRHAAVMPCYLSGPQMFGTKLLIVNDREHSRYPSVIVLQDLEANIIAVVDGTSITNMRTGAAAAVAAKSLARPAPWRVGVIGAGNQARFQIEALAALGRLAQLRVYAPTRTRAEALCRELARELGIPAEATGSAADAVGGADVVVTATTSATPVVRFEDLAPGVHINAVGAFGLGARELDDGTITTARIVVNDRELAVRESGELAIPIAHGVLRADKIDATLGEILCGEKPGRRNEAEMSVYKLVGASFLDIPLAWAACQAAGVSSGVPPKH